MTFISFVKNWDNNPEVISSLSGDWFLVNLMVISFTKDWIIALIRSKIIFLWCLEKYQMSKALHPYSYFFQLISIFWDLDS